MSIAKHIKEHIILGASVRLSADKTGGTDASSSFQSAASSLNNAYGGTIYVPAGNYVAQAIPLDTGSPNYAPIIWVGEGTDSTKITLPASPTSSMFKTAATGEFTGGGVKFMELVGDCSTAQPQLAEAYNASQDGIDLSSITGQTHDFVVEGCFIHGFKRAVRGSGDDRYVVYNNNRIWYNYTGIYVKNDHPIFTGMNDIRYNYWGIAGNVMYDILCRGQKINYNHYGVRAGLVITTSTADNTHATVMTDTALSLTTNGLRGYGIHNVTQRTYGIISANTVTTITSTIAWTSGDTYEFYNNSGGSLESCFFNDCTFFKNRKESVTLGVKCSAINNLIVPPSNPAISSITASGNVLTVTTTGTDPKHYLNVGDPVVLYGTQTGTLSVNVDNVITYTVTSVTSTTIFTVDIGTPVTGSTSAGYVCTNMSDVIVKYANRSKVSLNKFREETNERCGIASVYIYGTSDIYAANITDNEFSADETSANRGGCAIAMNFTAGGLFDSFISGNNCSEYAQLLHIVSGNLERCHIQNNHAYLDFVDSLGSTRDIIGPIATAYGNVITGNFIRFGANYGVSGRYVINANCIRSAVQGNIIRYPAARFTAGFNASAVDANTVGGITAAAHTATVGDNSITNF